MDPSVEIRKLTLSNIRQLSDLLDRQQSWEQLMASIPKTLERGNYECEMGGLKKYKFDDITKIQQAGRNGQRSCAEILLDEWGTSGRIRPTLGHLLFLLKHAELFRAAEFVTDKILKINPPERPIDGPAAHVPIPSSLLETNSINNNLNNNTSKTVNFDKSIPTNNQSVSDMMKFSVTRVSENELNNSLVQSIPVIKITDTSNNIPDLGTLMDDASTRNSVHFEIPEVSESNVPETSSNGPNLSVLMQESSTNSNSVSTDSTSTDTNIPLISTLLPSTSSESDNSIVPTISSLLHSETPETSNGSISTQLSSTSSESDNSNVPTISALLHSATPQTSNGSLSDIPHFSSLMQTSNSSNRRPQCSSPLPNLSLNTKLPHFNYHELEAATNNFNEVRYKNSLEMENSMDENNGRLLGSGAFGSVYLAFGLLDQPIAVKKLDLKEPDKINIDHSITKQFRNEVEILSKYNHENLLSICGYSCDGATYCLLYDYISGGALNYRLEKHKEQLNWQQRINIALGTAEAVAYLHTAFSTPLIHRDIKTANILLDHLNKPKLGDFGIIKLTPNQNTNVSTTIIGTAAYMAPEAFRSGDVSIKTDSYSFGVVILELLTALPPVDENRGDLITYVVEKCEDDLIAPLLDTTAGTWCNGEHNISEELFEIANKCLEEKKKRINMVEVRDLLKNINVIL